MALDPGDTAIVRVEEGQLRGRKVESRAGGHFWSFQGVPYARPPLGHLRFKDPHPMGPWDGVRDALKEGDKCRQFDGDLAMEYVGSEDCLFLNVYMPQLPEPQVDPLPVMVYIHGGAFQHGSGDTSMLGPDYLVGDGVILVTMNYRLGVLGFFSLEEACPGNVGLKDQVAALRWVQRNITAFGGDPSNVTIFGISAGGASVHLHMLSPMSKGLFQRAIAMSGAALNPWAVQTEPVDTARRLARVLGFKGADSDHHDILRFLRGVDCKELVRAANEVKHPKDEGRFLSFSFVPTPEKAVPGVQAFLPQPVARLMKEGKHHDVPFMTGVTEMESLLVAAFVDFRKEEIMKEVDSKWETNVLPELRLDETTKSDEALKEIRRFFMGGKPLSTDTLKGFMDMVSDITFNEGIFYVLRCLEHKHTAPVYQYIFTIDDELNFLKFVKKIDAKAACHADDLGYLFRVECMDPDLTSDAPAALARRRFVRLWTNFAKTGDPTPVDDPLLGIRWKQYAAKERNYLDIGAQLRPGTDLFAERVDFWKKFYDTFGTN